MNFSLPPEISSHKEIVQGCYTYVFRHNKLGEIGRIVVKGLPNGHCNILSEVVGDTDDPMTETRKEIFGPISKQITGIMESLMGKGEMAGSNPPPGPQPPGEIVESKLIPCERCGGNVALLIFAYEATKPGYLEDYARKMYPQYSKLDVLTWIIGPPSGQQAGFHTPSEVMKVWPNRESIKTITADEFNKDLDLLLEKHCS